MRDSILLDRMILDMRGKYNPTDFLTLRDCFENVLITGSTGSGKTSSSGAALAHGLLNKQGLKPHEKVGMVVFLYKAGDAEDWLRWCYQQGREDDVIHIRASDVGVFNILERYADQEPMNAVNMLMSISGLSNNGNRKESEAFWEVQQRIRLDRGIRAIQMSGELMNVETLYRLHVSSPNDIDQLTSEDFAKHSYCWEMMAKAAERVGESYRDFQLVEDYFFRQMPNLADRTSSSILAMVSSVLEPFVSSLVLNNLLCKGTSLKLEEVFRGKILLLDIPIQTHEHVGRIAQIILGHCLQKAVEQRDLKTHGNPVIFWQDECQNFITPFTHQFMSTCRSSRAGSVLITQNLANLRASMGGGYTSESKVNSLLGLCNTRIMHANNCIITNEFGANSIGKAFINLGSVNIGGQNNASAGTSQSLHYQVEPREFTMLRKGGQINDYVADAIITGTGKAFSNGLNFLRGSFKQHFAWGESQ